MSDAPTDHPRCSGGLPDLRHGAGATDGCCQDEKENPELTDMRRRFWISVALTLPLLFIAMGEMIVHRALDAVISMSVRPWVELALATPVVLWGGWPFLVRGVQSVVHRSLNMFTLIGLGVSVAYGYSIVATLAPGLVPAIVSRLVGARRRLLRGRSGDRHARALGQVLELKARGQTSAAIRALLRLAPKTARRVRDDGSDEDVPLDEVRVGDRLRIRPGERVPVDGRCSKARAASMNR